jgi:hypothetical protein
MAITSPLIHGGPGTIQFQRHPESIHGITAHPCEGAVTVKTVGWTVQALDANPFGMIGSITCIMQGRLTLDGDTTYTFESVSTGFHAINGPGPIVSGSWSKTRRDPTWKDRDIKGSLAWRPSIGGTIVGPRGQKGSIIGESKLANWECSAK